MYCKRIRAVDFRNIEEADVCFSDGVNILVGRNAQGKTNLLEAVFYASVGRSFRASHSAEMIRFGSPAADISLDYRDSKRQSNIHVRIFKDKQKLVEKNRVKMDRLSDIVGSFRAVLFCPEHLSLIKDGPSERRSYLDMAISRIYPTYMRSLQRYGYILKQRNALIKSAYSDRSVFNATIELWSEQLAAEAAVISDMRQRYIERASVSVAECFTDMTGEREVPTLFYDGSSGQVGEEYKDREAVRKKYFSLLTENYEREIAVGSTLWGIHKDDIDIRLNGRSARIYGSQGQQRSLALALKLAEGEICRQEFGDEPVLLFDDVLSELDSERRDYLTKKLVGKQVIITTCEDESIVGLGSAKVIRVENGRYFE